VHGLIFASLRDYTTLRVGHERSVELWSDRVFEAHEAYEDEWFVAQLNRLGRATGEPLDEIQRGFGSFAAQETFARLFPGYYEESGDIVTFLLGIEETIHEVVRATIPGAAPPRLHVQPLRNIGVLVSYTSDRKLCQLLEGLVRGTAKHYGDEVVVEEIQCMRRGDPGCVFTVVRAE
jgi:predicted hydrocarbon binding protein